MKSVVHQYKNNGYNIVMDVNSGSIHVVDDVVYDVIPLMEEMLCSKIGKEEMKDKLAEQLGDKYDVTDVLEAFEQVEDLKDSEQLYTPDIYEKYIIDFKKRQTVVKALCLHIAHDCNLACKYCFAEEGEISRQTCTYEL